MRAGEFKIQRAAAAIDAEALEDLYDTELHEYHAESADVRRQRANRRADRREAHIDRQN